MTDTNVQVLTASQRVTLDALCRRIVPAAYAAHAISVDLPAAVEARLASGDAGLRAQVATLLTAFDHPFAGLLFSLRPRRFSRLDPPSQDAWLHAWERSRIPQRRTIFQAFRRLILSTYYAMPAAHPGIGFLGPFHLRTPVVPWEGVLSGEPSDAEPVARGPIEARAHASPVATQSSHVAPPQGVTQGHEIDRDIALHADVCVIGTGAGGAVAAARLAEAGYDVIVLEEGGYWSGMDFTEGEAEMVPRLYADRGMRATDDLAINLLQGRCVGGGTTLNWMLMLRPPESVLDEWAREHGTEGMAAADLAPVLELIEAESHARLVPVDAHAPGNRTILDGARKLGWSAGAGRINAHRCVRSGFCHIGCRYGAKRGTLTTFVPRALAAGARLYSDVRVERVEVRERGGAAPGKRVVAEVIERSTSVAQHTLTVDAPIVVLAGGAVGTPAILQRSGLGGGGVGRYLRLHPTSAVVGAYDREMYPAAGIPQSALSDEFLRSDGGYGSWIESSGFLPGLASVAVPGFGDEHRHVMQQFPRLGVLIVLTRDGADRARSDGEVRVDRRGRVRIHYRVAERTARTLHEGLVAAARLHLAAGAVEALTLHNTPVRVRTERDTDAILRAPRGSNQLSMFSAHVNGTCRLGTDPRTSGCTPDGERHGVPGLYIADGSILPTAPGVNPQETIMALATIIARRIVDRHPLGRAGAQMLSATRAE